MAGLDASVIGNLKPPAQMTLGDLMNVATSAQAYKQAQQINPLAVRKQQAETDVSEQTAAPRISSAISQASTAETGATSAAQTLAEKQQAGIANGFVNRIFDPLVTKAAKSPELLTDKEKQQLVNNTTEWGIKQGKELGIDADKASQLVQPYIDVATNNPGGLQAYYKSRHIQGLSGGEQTGVIAGQTAVNAAGQAFNINPYQGTTSAYQQTGGDQVLNPRQPLGTYSTDIYGNKVFIPNTPQGGIGQPQAIGGTQTQQPPQMTIPPGETPASMAFVTDLRNNANKAASTVRVQQDSANQIIKLADETNTGVGAQIMKNLGGGFAGLPWTSDNAANFDKLGHYIAQNSIILANQAGLGTDSGRDLQSQASGSTTFTKDGLKAVARTNRALSSGVDLFNRGVENAVQRTGNPFAARDFQNQWSTTADVNSLRLYDALNNHDNAAIRDVVKSVGGTKSQGYKDLTTRMAKMKQLIQGQ